MHNLIKIAAIGMMALSMSGIAQAQQFTVEVNKTKRLNVRGAASLLIGDSRVADATTQPIEGGSLIFISGRSFGTTNILIYDSFGKELYSGDVVVTTNTSNLVSVNRGGATNTYDCAPRCRSVLAVGDDLTYFNSIAEQSDAIQELSEDAN